MVGKRKEEKEKMSKGKVKEGGTRVGEYLLLAGTFILI